MRGRWVLGLVLALAACAEGPGALGLTGPSAPTPPSPPDDAQITAPGVPGGSQYAPNITPTTGGGRYYGYN